MGDSASAPAPAPSRRYSDKRRFTSRVAARERRSTESDLLHDLGRSLPITQFTLNSLDKISILRLAVANLKLRGLFGYTSRGKALLDPGGGGVDELLHGGFLIVIGASGDVVYVSEGISDCLGLTAYEVTGKSIYDYTHPSDQPDLHQLLMPDEGFCELNRSALVRLKCNLFPNINPMHFRPLSNKVIYLTGKMYLQTPVVDVKEGSLGSRLGPCFIGVGRTIPHPADNGYPFPSTGNRMFTSVHSIKDLAFIRTDQRIEALLRFSPSDLVNRKGLDLVHGEDTHLVLPVVRDLHSKGQAQSPPYRFLCKDGGWAWMISEGSTLFTNTYRANTLCPASAVFCRHMVISEIQTNEILSLLQLPTGARALPEPESKPSPEACDEDKDQGSSTAKDHDLINTHAAGLFEEFLHSGTPPCTSDSESDESLNTATWQAQPQPGAGAIEFSSQMGKEPPALVTASDRLSPIKDEPFELCDDMSFLQMLTGDDVDFGALPEFKEALNALLVEEESPPLRLPECEGQSSSLWSQNLQDSILDLNSIEKVVQVNRCPTLTLKRKADEINNLTTATETTMELNATLRPDAALCSPGGEKYPRLSALLM